MSNIRGKRTRREPGPPSIQPKFRPHTISHNPFHLPTKQLHLSSSLQLHQVLPRIQCTPRSPPSPHLYHTHKITPIHVLKDLLPQHIILQEEASIATSLVDSYSPTLYLLLPNHPYLLLPKVLNLFP